MVTATKAPESFIVLLRVPCLVMMMLFIRRQYEGQTTELHLRNDVVFAGLHRHAGPAPRQVGST